MAFFDLAHPWLKPLWVRCCIVLVCFGWAAVEWITGAPGWAIVFGAGGGYCLYAFFLSPHRSDDAD
jgi:hypothetical protein